MSFAASDCPFAGDELDTIIERKLTTSRLQPKRWATWLGVYDELLVLAVHVGCLGRQTGNPVFDLDVHFAVYFQDRRAVRRRIPGGLAVRHLRYRRP